MSSGADVFALRFETAVIFLLDLTSQPELMKPLKIVAHNNEEATMGSGRGVLLWLIGIPLPIILLLAIFMHH